MPGGAAEVDYLNGRKANLDATLGLFEVLAGMPREQGSPAARVVFGEFAQ